MRIDRRILPGTTFDETGTQAIVHADQNAANARGANAVDLQSVRAAATQVASGSRSFIGSGSNNTASGTATGVICGVGNTNSALNSLLGCGQLNTLSASGGGSFLGTGAFNQISGTGSLNFLGTGFINSITGSVVGSAIATGNQVSITSGSYNAILTGQTSSVQGTQSAMIAASGCVINGISAVVGGGFNHTITGDLALSGNGSGNSITSGKGGSYGNQILNGGANTIGSGIQFSTILNGLNNDISSSAFSTILHGDGVSTFSPREIAFGGVRQDSTNGTVQAGWHVLTIDTSDNSLTEMTIDGAAYSTANQINIPVDTTIAFELRLVAMEQRTSGSDWAAWHVASVIQNLNGTTAIAGATLDINKSDGSNSNAPPTGWGFSVAADNANDQLNIYVQNAGTTTDVRWVARISYTQVRYT